MTKEHQFVLNRLSDVIKELAEINKDYQEKKISRSTYYRYKQKLNNIKEYLEELLQIF